MAIQANPNKADSVFDDFKNTHPDTIIHTVGMGEVDQTNLDKWANGGAGGSGSSLITSPEELESALQNGSSSTTGNPMGQT